MPPNEKMIPFLFASWTILLASANCASASDASTLPQVDQFYIQTDGGEGGDGGQRFFRYQTSGGQFRKETVDEDDGAVVGTFGWVDAAGVLRTTDYVADERGYRVLRTKAVKLGAEGGQEGRNEVNEARVRKALERFRKKKAHHKEQGRDARAHRQHKLETALANEIAPEVNERLERRVDRGNGVVTIKVQPLFQEAVGREENDLLPAPFFVRRIQPRGEGSRLRYDPETAAAIEEAATTREGRKLLRRRVVKRRRRPDALDRVTEGGGKKTVDYQTEKAYHRERVSPVDGSRIGEFGYIDPLGVRRVVTYATGPGDEGSAVRVKENDYVGDRTYFQSV